MSDFTLVVEGLKETRQAIKKLSPEADKELKVAMRDIANEVRDKAKAEAKRKGLVGKRGSKRSKPNLITGIKRGSVTMDKAEIKSTAFRQYEVPEGRPPGNPKRGYNRRKNRSGQLRRSYVGKDFAYPMVYEFGDRGKGSFGARAFMNPALMKSRDMIERELLKAVDDAARKAGFQ